MNGTTDFHFVVDCLRRHEADWCVIGGLAVNAYAPPVYTADLDLVVVATDFEAVLADLRAADFRVKEFEFSINAQRRAGPGGSSKSMLMVQFSKVERYRPFVARASLRPVFGMDVPVAALGDLVSSKTAAWIDPTRRESKRAKDESDLLRLGENHAEVISLLPAPLRERLQQQRERGGFDTTEM